MTINPSTVSTSAYDLLDGSVSSFYAQVDEAIVASEVVKGQYRMTINPAYNSPNVMHNQRAIARESALRVADFAPIGAPQIF